MCRQCYKVSSQHCFSYVPQTPIYFSFQSIECVFRFPLGLPFWIAFEECYSVSKRWRVLISGLSPSWLKNIFCIIYILLNFLRVALWPWIWFILFVCHGHLKRTCVLLLFGGIICKCRLYPVDWWCWNLYPWRFSVQLFCLLMEELEISSCYCEFVSSFNSISVPSHSLQFFV